MIESAKREQLKYVSLAETDNYCEGVPIPLQAHTCTHSNLHTEPTGSYMAHVHTCHSYTAQRVRVQKTHVHTPIYTHTHSRHTRPAPTVLAHSTHTEYTQSAHTQTNSLCTQSTAPTNIHIQLKHTETLHHTPAAPTGTCTRRPLKHGIVNLTPKPIPVNNLNQTVSIIF